MNFRITHTTVYEYRVAVSLCHSVAFIHPRETPRQTCLDCQIVIDPPPDTQASRDDYFGNHRMNFAIQRAHRRLSVRSVSEVRIAPRPAALPSEGPGWEEARDRLHAPGPSGPEDPVQYIHPSPLIRADEELAGYARQSFPAGRPLLEAVADLTARIHADFIYDPAATQVHTPLEQVWAQRRGVCQDFAHLQIAGLRALGLPARYVSGYLQTHTTGDQPRLIGADASHAWISVHCPDVGWVDFDPTNNLRPWDQHVTIAWGRDFSDV
ncbi:MAG: transglutaminase family protein, partial [Planctomycetota bacterium]|nr:transglutaminase family protein [Planctomycetota bacterium]